MTRRRSAAWSRAAPADPAQDARAQVQAELVAGAGDLRGGLRPAPLGRHHGARGRRGRRTPRAQPAGAVAPGVGRRAGHRRRFLPPHRRSPRSQRELAEGDPSLGAGQEDRADRRGRQPDDQPALGQLDDPAFRARRRPRASAMPPPPPRSRGPTWRSWRGGSSPPSSAASRRSRRTPSGSPPTSTSPSSSRRRTSSRRPRRSWPGASRRTPTAPSSDSRTPRSRSAASSTPSTSTPGGRTRSLTTPRSRPSSTSTPTC